MALMRGFKFQTWCAELPKRLEFFQNTVILFPNNRILISKHMALIAFGPSSVSEIYFHYTTSHEADVAFSK